MVKTDLERVGIAYEAHEGIADFHAAGRHSHITGSLRNGATLVEARLLARHAHMRRRMKYTHIGPQDQADVLVGLPNPNACTTANWLCIGRDLGGAQGQAEAPPVGEPESDAKPINEQSPAGAGLCVVFCRKLSIEGSLQRSGGGGNCTRVPRSFGEGLYVRSRSFDCRRLGPGRQGPFRLSSSWF